MAWRTASLRGERAAESLPGSADAVETPSGKGAGDENFPVGSILIARRLRPHVATFYAFARAIDDIADSSRLAPEDKLSRLDGFESAILGGEAGDPRYAKAHRMRASLVETGVTTQHCMDLVAAFKRDATKLRYRDWDDLMGYCYLSASPVGRYLLDLHGEPRSAYFASDALCNALQVINHLQDCKSDYLTLNRVYVPEPWLREAGASVEHLGRERSTKGVRAALDRTLAATRGLLVDARKLPALLGSRRLAAESAAIERIAERLCALLRRRDPVAERVELTKAGFLTACLGGVLRGLVARRARAR